NQYSYVRNLPTVKVDADGHGDAGTRMNQCQNNAACRAADEKDLKEHPFMHVAGPVLVMGAEAAIVFVPAIAIDIITAVAQAQSDNNQTPTPQPGQQPAPATEQPAPQDGKGSTLQPGPHAGEGVPARGPQRDFTQDERDKINQQGQQNGCHTCGTTDPGTKSGNFVPDHQPPNGL